ncbi:hypothetical protein EDB87DRAFT_19492 [Lactarius vividus]|nr:hypothetical protein EDB87DRAFT_19492 [Lactarius vividus]
MSAWARGPRATTTPSRLESPAQPTPVSVTNPPNFHATHSRRSDALGQGVSIKVNIPRGAVKQDDASAPVPSSPAYVPAIKPADSVKSFGSVAVQNGVSDAAKSAVLDRLPHLSSAPSTSLCEPVPPSTSIHSPVPKFDKKSIAKLFSGPSTQTIPSPATWSGYYYHPQFVPGVPPGSPSMAPPPSAPPTANRPTSEINLDALKRLPPPAVPIVPTVSLSPASVKKKKKKRLVLLESQKHKEKRLAEEKAREGESEEKDGTSEPFANPDEDAARPRFSSGRR